ncbi:MAG: hypothetical protein GY832_17850 [Chloroflexi bacterium]|nr:hypothetical protein [Chloroflexota bacterium]
MVNRVLSQPEVKAARTNGRHQLLDLGVAQLLVLRDAAPIVSRAVSMRVPLPLNVIHAIAVTDPVISDEAVSLDSER